MKNNKNKIIGIILALIVVIICILLSLLIVINKRNKGQEEVYEDNVTNEVVQKQNEAKLSAEDYIMASNCINSYLSTINVENSAYYRGDENGNQIKVISDEQIANKILRLLNDKFIAENNINSNNVFQFIHNNNKYLKFTPLDMKEYKGENANTYAVYGCVSDQENNFIGYIYSVVNIDKNTKAFSIIPIDKQKYDNWTDTYDYSIERNDVNMISDINITEEVIMKKYFEYYRNMLLSNTDLAYEYLNEEYREKAFPTKEEFARFVEYNKTEYSQTKLETYEIFNGEGDYTEYLEEDKNSKCYIFNISNNDANDYNVMLDSYVIGTTKLKDAYNNGDDNKKVQINARKFIYALKDKNYSYAYSLLDETFKENRFNNLDTFIDYTTRYFSHDSTIDSDTIKYESGYYIYTMKLTDENGGERNLTIVEKLGEGTDFSMSFSF